NTEPLQQSGADPELAVTWFDRVCAQFFPGIQVGDRDMSGGAGPTLQPEVAAAHHDLHEYPFDLVHHECSLVLHAQPETDQFDDGALARPGVPDEQVQPFVESPSIGGFVLLGGA